MTYALQIPQVRRSDGVNVDPRWRCDTVRTIASQPAGLIDSRGIAYAAAGMRVERASGAHELGQVRTGERPSDVFRWLSEAPGLFVGCRCAWSGKLGFRFGVSCCRHMLGHDHSRTVPELRWS